VNKPAIVAATALLSGLLALAAVSPAGARNIEREPLPIVRQWTGLQAADDDERAVEPPILWTVVGVAGVAVVGGSLYLFKRRVGAFPKDPDWVAPISLMPAGENAEEEGDYPAAPAEHH
jgi:hypothetical protein